MPTYGESEEIVADTLHYLTLQDVPLERVSVVLAFEERDPIAPSARQRLSARFAPLFQHFLITFHPDLHGEVRGKSANLTWAARRVAGGADRHRPARSRAPDRHRAATPTRGCTTAIWPRSATTC